MPRPACEVTFHWYFLFYVNCNTFLNHFFFFLIIVLYLALARMSYRLYRKKYTCFFFFFLKLYFRSYSQRITLLLRKVIYYRSTSFELTWIVAPDLGVYRFFYYFFFFTESRRTYAPPRRSLLLSIVASCWIVFIKMSTMVKVHKKENNIYIFCSFHEIGYIVVVFVDVSMT